MACLQCLPAFLCLVLPASASIPPACGRATNLHPPVPPCDASRPAGRLEDKSSLVRKEALRLLQSLMLHNPFGPKLPVDRFEATLLTHRAMLDQLVPPEGGAPAPGQEGDALQEQINVEGQEAAAEGQEGVAVKQEPSVEEMEVDGEAAAAEEGTAEGDEEEEQQPTQPTRSREAGFCCLLAVCLLDGSWHCLVSIAAGCLAWDWGHGS